MKHEIVKFALEILVTVVLAIIVFGNIAKKAGYSRWCGLMMAIPFLNVVAILFLAFSVWPIEQRTTWLEQFTGDTPEPSFSGEWWPSKRC